jgi:hypothetical protein
LGARTEGGAPNGGEPAIRAAESPPRRLETAVLRTQAKQALVGLGWKPAIAGPAIEAASAAFTSKSSSKSRAVSGIGARPGKAHLRAPSTRIAK